MDRCGLRPLACTCEVCIPTASAPASCLLSCPAQVWDAFSYATVSPALPLILLPIFMPAAAGAWPEVAASVVLGSVLGGSLALGIMYATLAANGGSWASSTTKGATFVCLLSAAGGALNTLRRWHSAALLVVSAQLSLVLSGRCALCTLARLPQHAVLPCMARVPAVCAAAYARACMGPCT